MKKIVVFGFALCLLWRADACAQAINGELSGQIVTASVSVPKGQSATVYTVPTNGDFVLTKVGPSKRVYDDKECDPVLVVFMTNVKPKAGASPFAWAVHPGEPLPPGALLECEFDKGCPTSDCYMTGVFKKW